MVNGICKYLLYVIIGFEESRIFLYSRVDSRNYFVFLGRIY